MWGCDIWGICLFYLTGVVWRLLSLMVSQNTWSGEQDTQPSDRNRQALLPNFVHSAKVKAIRLGKKPLFRLNCFLREQLSGFSSRLCSVLPWLYVHGLLLILRPSSCCDFCLQAQCQTRSWRCPLSCWEPAEPPQPASTHSHLPAEV